MIFVVVPAYNEEKKIGRVIRGLFEHGLNQIIVVNDGSTDNTAYEARMAGAQVVEHLINRGQGAALETGNSIARSRGAEVVVHFDADEQFNPADIMPAIIKLQTENLDVILGSRFLDNRSKLPWTKRKIILPFSRLINYLLTGVSLSDAHNGFRVLSKKALNNLVIRQDRMAHNSEIISQIKIYGLKYAEQPVEVRYFEYGQSALGGFKILKDLFLAKIIK